MKKATYRLSVRQILFIAFLSALCAAVTVACFDRVASRLQPSGAAFNEAQPAGVTEPSVVSDERNNIEVYRAVSPGVVFITSTSFSRDFFDYGERQGSGSGSVIDEEGHILTNEHVIAGAQRLSVSFGGERTFPAQVVGTDRDTDLAVLKVSNVPRELLKPVAFGDSDRLVVGQKVLAIGNPFGLDRTLTTGVISGLQRPIRARNNRQIEGAIQTDASINPGNSGGPLLDSQGRMIGINSQILSPAGGSVGVGFAVPVSIAKRVVPQLIRSGVVVRPKLGISTFNVGEVRSQADLPVQEGVGLLQVQPGGAAAAAGLRGLQQTYNGDLILGDIIVAIDGEQVKDRDDLFRLLDKRQVGDTIRVEVVREGRRVNVPVRLLPEQQQRGIFRR